MDCPITGLDQASSFYQRIGVNRRRTPISGSIELTFRCNLRCGHCYLGDHRGSGSQVGELTTAELMGLFDQMADAGTLWLLLTGGEPLLRPDFREIYSYAKHKGFVLSLFTNGTLLTPELADFLADLPPHNMEITLYGATRETYEKVTRVKGSYDRCMRAIDLLLARAIPLKLKAMATTLTVAEIPAMAKFARGLGLEFRFDPILFNDLDHKQEPFPYRLPAEEVMRLDVSDPDRLREWQDYYPEQLNAHVDDRFIYSCGAGINTYHIDPYGQMSICMSVRGHQYDLRNGKFSTGWENYLYQDRFTLASEKSKCSQCTLQPLCGQCPAWGESENVVANEPIQYLCQIGQSRARAFGLSI